MGAGLSGRKEVCGLGWQLALTWTELETFYGSGKTIFSHEPVCSSQSKVCHTFLGLEDWNLHTWPSSQSCALPCSRGTQGSSKAHLSVSCGHQITLFPVPGASFAGRPPSTSLQFEGIAKVAFQGPGKGPGWPGSLALCYLSD